MGEGYFLKDTALMEKSKDAFHHEDYVKNLKRIIEEHEPPFNIALIGKWGVGKSSIINLLKKELEGKQEVVTHEINAWRYENDSLKKAFLKNLWQTFNKDKDISQFKLLADSFRGTSVQAAIEDKPGTIKQTLKGIFQLMLVFLALFLISSACILFLLYLWDAINAVFTSNTLFENTKDTFKTFKENIWISILIAPMYKMLQELIKSSMQTKVADVKLIKPVETADEYEELFKNAISKYKKDNPQFKKLVVIVDDLDRLSTKKVVAALDAIKAFVEINECIFIVTCDENILINALEKEKLNKSVDVDGELFLDKLFHFRIALPPIIDNDMREYANNIANQEIPGLVKLCNGQFEDIIDILIHAEVSTPRQVKKLLNTFSNNLLIAHSREAQNRKLEHKLLTGENGIKFLAKLSVIQSDYNDIYMKLGEDFSYLEDLLSFYQEKNLDGKDIKPSIKMLFNQKDTSFKIKPYYEGLMNFLIRTQHINVENIAPFIYLAQDAIGLKAGDEKQRAIRKNLVSGNEKGIITLLDEEPNPENLVYAIIEEVKHSTRKDLPSVIKAGIQLISHITEQRKELANAISIQLTKIETDQIRFWQVEQKNLLAVYHSADNKPGIEKAFLFVLDELFSRSEKWKTSQGKEAGMEDFIFQISSVLELLLPDITTLPISISDKVKAFLENKSEDYKFYPFDEIYTLYQNHNELFLDYFNLSFFIQLVGDMENREGNKLKEKTETFLEIAPKIRERYSNEFIESMPSVINSSPKSKVLEILRMLTPVLEMVDEKSGSKIVDAIISYTFWERNDIKEVMTTLQKIPFNIKFYDEFGERLDLFIEDHMTKEEKYVTSDIIDVMEYVLSSQNVDFGLFVNTFNCILKNVLETSVYDEVLDKLNSYFTESQRQNLFSKINSPAIFQSYNASLFERVYALYALLEKNAENNPYIQSVMKQSISIFQNNQWSQKTSWANDFVKLFSIVANKLEESDLLNFINALFGNVSNQGRQDLVIKSLMHIGKHIPESKAIESINYVINNANTDSSKIDAFEYLKTCNQYITEDNNNLTPYANYLLDNFHLKVESFLNELYSEFSFISEEHVIKLITKTANLEEEKLQSNIATIQNTTERFFSALKSDESRVKILNQVLQKDVKVEAINSILLTSLEKNSVVSLLNDVITSDIEMDKNYRGKLLQLCIPYHDSLSKASMTNLIVDVLRDNDDDYIIEMCNLLLNQYNDFKFNHEKKHIATQIVPTFRNVNMGAKEKVLEVAKMFGLVKEFEQAIKDKLLSDEELDLVFKVTGLRKSRFYDRISK